MKFTLKRVEEHFAMWKKYSNVATIADLNELKTKYCQENDIDENLIIDDFEQAIRNVEKEKRRKQKELERLKHQQRIQEWEQRRENQQRAMSNPYHTDHNDLVLTQNKKVVVKRTHSNNTIVLPKLDFQNLQMPKN